MRSSWKVSNSLLLLKNCKLSFEFNKNKAILPRSLTITPSLAHSGLSIFVPSGNSFVKVDLRGNGCGLKLGSFVFTKALGRKIHIEKKKKRKK